MRWSRLGFEGKLARRLLALLLVAAWLPLALLVWTSLGEYQSRLSFEAESRLSERAKNSGLEIFRRLETLRADLDVLGGDLVLGSEPLDLLPARASWSDRFEALIATWDFNAPAQAKLPGLDARARLRLEQRRATLIVEPTPTASQTIWLISPVQSSTSALIWARVRISWLWPESEDAIADGEAWALLGRERGQPLASSADLPQGLLESIQPLSRLARGGLRWTGEGGRPFLAHFWTIPLSYELGHSGLTVLVNEPYRVGPSVMALRRILILVSVAALLLIAIVGVRRLRSDLGPLEELTAGARLLEGGRLATRVEVRSRDEVGKLSEAFNRMAQRLEQQFHQVRGIQSIAASALVASPNADEVARVFIEQATPIAGDAEIVLALVDGGGAIRRAFSTTRSELSVAEAGDLAERATKEGRGPSEKWTFDDADSAWRALRRGEQTLALVGVTCLGREGLEQRITLLSGACDQVALALSRVLLLGELERANWGALTALARAVDEKSPWTHGHSIRVAEIAAAIAAQVEFSPEEIRRIRRGCLVHDVGKIGIPSAVLDKRGSLNDGERAVMRSHVEKGARILEPIDGLIDVMPIVWQHHERLDGSGYPKGLCDGEIDPAAALVAVAYAFEALTAARPYRPARAPEMVEDYLKRLAGVQFDARFVEALTQIREHHDSWAKKPEPAAQS